MYTRQEREGILWEFHRSGLSVRRACATLPLFPNPDDLYRWLGLERGRGNHVDVLAREAELLARHAGRRVEHLARVRARLLARIAHTLLQRLLDALMLLDERARRLRGELVARHVRLLHDPAQVLDGNAL